ncbi:hypothetical protein QUF63_00150 [Anaerolineales bacterium HSG25]|nr:hypothetical protein [Anaerolineales bacterium HSG25]
MITVKTGGPPPQRIDKESQLNNKILEMAQILFIDELAEDTLIACGEDFTTRSTGKYGRYETVNGEIIAFQPHRNQEFMLLCDEFVLIDDLAMIRTIVHHVDDYDISIAS